MKAKIVNVVEEDWDFLIVLDACRFDYFLEVYKDFFDGKLEKIISASFSTVEWLKGLENVYKAVTENF